MPPDECPIPLLEIPAINGVRLAAAQVARKTRGEATGPASGQGTDPPAYGATPAVGPGVRGHSNGPRVHNETIIPIAPNPMWGTDATATWMQQQGQVIVIAVLDHFAGECLGIHAASYGFCHEALEPVR
ncbi:MAG: hypothetical protein VST67_08585 [Nitrospirota bacterium]|nr:hypothetical protein [Nitrospirota bacterium]